MKSKWPTKKLGEVSNIVGGYAFKSKDLKDFKSSDNYLPVIKIGNLKNSGSFDLNDPQYYEFSKNLARFLIKKDDILVAMTGATTGKVAISDIDQLLLNQRVGLIRAKEHTVLQNYLKLTLLSNLFYKYCQITAGGGAQGNISPSQIMNFALPLPSLLLQKRIVERLDAIRKAQELCDKQISKTEELYQCLVDKEIIDGDYDQIELGNVVKPQTIINPQATPEKEFDYINISSIDSTHFLVNQNEIKHFKGKDAPSRARKIVVRGDLLFATVRPNLKRIAKIDFPTLNSLASTGFTVLSPDTTKVNPSYLGTVTCSGIVTNQVLPFVHGAAYPSVSDSDVLKAKIPFPKRGKQDEIAKKFVAVEEYKILLLRQKSLLKELFDSVLYKSMKGEMD